MARRKKEGQAHSRAGQNGADLGFEDIRETGDNKDLVMEKSRHYWLDLFSLKTWAEFVTAGANTSGFRKSRSKMVQKVKTGDYLLCYLTGLSRFVGVLEVQSEPYEDESMIWEGEPFPCRLRVRPVVMLEPETAVPVSEIKDRLSMFQNLKFPGAWSVYFRTSPAKLKEPDSEVIIRALEDALANPVRRPYDAAKWDSKPKALPSNIGPVIVPETDENTSMEGKPSKEGTNHSEMQWLLLKVGQAMGHDVWVARNDRSKSWKGQPFSVAFSVPEKLPLQFDEATNLTIELIDVLWMKKNAVVAAFEIESTTSIYSGLLRMSDLVSMQPNINIPLYIVAPDERREKVISEINRPTFSRLPQPLSSLCRFIPFSALRDFVDKHEAFLRHFKPDVIASDEVSESCEVDEI